MKKLVEENLGDLTQKQQCRFCVFYKYDFEYGKQELGDCTNDEFNNCIDYSNADYFFISDDFGCIFFKNK